MKIYVRKDNLRQFQWFPVPTDLEDWYEAETQVSIPDLAGMEFDPSAGEFIPASAIAEGIARSKRDSLLRDADVKMSIAFDQGETDTVDALKQYREELRAIPEQEGFPHEVDWPQIN